MIKQFLTAVFLAGAILFCGTAGAATSLADAAKSKMVVSPVPVDHVQETRMIMRKLWEDHITYTRNYIISAVAGLGDAKAVGERLMQNQDDIGNAIKPYYGVAAGDQLAALLREHIKIATEVVTAAKKNDKPALDAAQKKWDENADDLAGFLSGANPYWDKQKLSDMLHKHLELTAGEATFRLNKNWKADIDFYDKGHVHMLKFADMLVAGLAQQFPDKFQ